MQSRSDQGDVEMVLKNETEEDRYGKGGKLCRNIKVNTFEGFIS